MRLSRAGLRGGCSVFHARQASLDMPDDGGAPRPFG